MTATIIVVHDYSVTVTQELLARRAEGALAVDLVAVHLQNGGLTPTCTAPSLSRRRCSTPSKGRGSAPG